MFVTPRYKGVTNFRKRSNKGRKLKEKEKTETRYHRAFVSIKKPPMKEVKCPGLDSNQHNLADAAT